MARQIKSKDPEADITWFYMDMQNVGRDFAASWSDFKSNIHWIREIPGDFFEADGERVGVIVETNDHIEELFFDLVILSVGMAPALDQDVLRGWLNLTVSREGFLLPEEDSGVFVIGSAFGPMSIVDSITHAHASVNKLMDYLDHAK
jgi:heterodisulfide reductase subunit A